MSHADDLDPYASLGQWLAAEVRRYRIRAGMEQQELAKHLRVSIQHMNNLEAARRQFTRDHAKSLDVVFGADGHFETLWVHGQREHDQEWFQKFTLFERRAGEMKIWQPLVIPGLFQTPAYAKALLESGLIKNIGEVVESRMKRQEILKREDPPLVFALIDERALRQPVPGPEAMREQLMTLLELAKVPHVILQVVPMTVRAHIGLDGGFILLDLGREEGQLAFIEAQLTGRLVRDEQEVHTLAVRYDRIRAKALSEEDSVRLIEQVMEQMRCSR